VAEAQGHLAIVIVSEEHVPDAVGSEGSGELPRCWAAVSTTCMDAV
jgi:hypothetical protein